MRLPYERADLDAEPEQPDTKDSSFPSSMRGSELHSNRDAELRFFFFGRFWATDIFKLTILEGYYYDHSIVSKMGTKNRINP